MLAVSKGMKYAADSGKSPREKVLFPIKLYEAAEDPFSIIKWTNGGKAITVDDERFEKEVCCAVINSCCGVIIMPTPSFL